MSYPSKAIGDFSVQAINVGNITLPIGPNLRGPASTRTDVLTAVAGQTIVPMQDLLVRCGDVNILVDAGSYDIGDTSGYAIAGYHAPPPLQDQLASIGVSRESVGHVVITHSHWDHFNGTTLLEGGRRVPTFPNARHYISRVDWTDMQSAIARKGTREAETFPYLKNAGLLRVIDDALEIEPGVMIIPAPGETPGHQIVRIASAGDTLYAVGDMYHHPIEVPFPDWMMVWADDENNRRSRDALLKDAVPEGAWLMASHIPGIGRLHSPDRTVVWK